MFFLYNAYIMKKVSSFTISTVSIKHKILSCVLAFFVLITSMNLLSFERYKETIMKSVEVSTDLVVSQFFHISALPASVISKIFSGKHESTVKKESIPIQPSEETTTVEQQTAEVIKTVATENETTNATANNKGTDKKDNNSIKASIGYSITSGISGINKVINSKWLKDLLIADRLIETSFVRYAESINFVSIEKIINIRFVMMLLLAILLARRNVGDNNIINNNINIKNKKIARFM